MGKYEKGVTPPQFKATVWQPGQSGNPGGKPKGRGRISRETMREIEIAANLKLADNARQLLQDESLTLVSEVVRIALTRDLRPEIRELEHMCHSLSRKSDKHPDLVALLRVAKAAVKAVAEEIYPSQAKVKCLLACLDRIAPSLKVVEVNQTDGRLPSDMTDVEILAMMERMVNLSELGRSRRLAGPPEVDG